MAPKIGRPIVGDERKDAQVGFRITPETAKKFNECKRLSGKNKVELFEEMVNALYDRLTQKEQDTAHPDK